MLFFTCLNCVILTPLGLFVQAEEGLYVLIIFISFKLLNVELTQGHFTKRFPVTFFFHSEYQNAT